jgi:hypothetical protein
MKGGIRQPRLKLYDRASLMRNKDGRNFGECTSYELG